MRMAESLWKGMFNDGPSIYYNPSFRVVLEYHLEWLRTRPRTVQAEIPLNMALRHEFDLFGFLKEIGIPEQLHWIVMRVNGLTSPEQFRTDSPVLLIPDIADIDELRTTFTTVHKIS
jgi:hypothetical protein